MPEVTADLQVEDGGVQRKLSVADLTALPVGAASEATLAAVEALLGRLPTAGAASEATLAAVRTLLGHLTDGTQVAKVATGDGTFVDHSNPLPVDVGANISISDLTVKFASQVSTLNSTMAPLGANEVFTGQWEDVVDYASITAAIFTDAASALNGAKIEFSADGANVLSTRSTSIPAGVPGAFILQPEARYMRVVYINGPAAQSVLANQVVLRFQEMTPQAPLGAQTDDSWQSTQVKAHLAARILSGPYTGLWSSLGTDGQGALLAAITGIPLPPGASTEVTQAKRYGGGKSAKTAQVQASGTTTIHTPATGKRVRVYWVSALNDPDQTQTPRIRIGFSGAADYFYSGYAVAHWEVFEGAVDQAVVVDLDQTGDVAVTMHYEEF